MDAACGAIVAAVLFEGLKRAFGYYLGLLGTYQTLYGALAVLPIFLIWMYLGWLVVLIGAEITASLPEWRSGRRDPRRASAPRRRAGAGARRAGELAQDPEHVERRGRLDYLSRELGAEIGKLTYVMDMLRGARMVVRSDNRRWVLARDLNAVTLNDLVSALNLSLADIQDVPRQTKEVMTDLAAAERGLLDRSIEDTLKSHGLT